MSQDLCVGKFKDPHSEITWYCRDEMFISNLILKGKNQPNLELSLHGKTTRDLQKPFRWTTQHQIKGDRNKARGTQVKPIRARVDNKVQMKITSYYCLLWDHEFEKNKQKQNIWSQQYTIIEHKNVFILTSDFGNSPLHTQHIIFH